MSNPVIARDDIPRRTAHVLKATKRRRMLWYVTSAALMVAVLYLLFVAGFVLPRLREGGELPNPIQMVKDWLFPPQLFVEIEVGIDAVVIETPIVDEVDIDGPPNLADPIELRDGE
jgi:hypothetical protein